MFPIHVVLSTNEVYPIPSIHVILLIKQATMDSRYNRYISVELVLLNYTWQDICLDSLHLYQCTVFSVFQLGQSFAEQGHVSTLRFEILRIHAKVFCLLDMDKQVVEIIITTNVCLRAEITMYICLVFIFFHLDKSNNQALLHSAIVNFRMTKQKFPVRCQLLTFAGL